MHNHQISRLSPLFFFLIFFIAAFRLNVAAADPVFVPNERSVNIEYLAEKPYLRQLKTHQDFLSMSRSYKKGRFNNIDHVMFLIDGSQGKVYFINSRRYAFHHDFAKEHYLTKDLSLKSFNQNYLTEKRHLILGSVVYHKNQPKHKQYVIELWEGDTASSTMWKMCYEMLQRQFKIASLAIKANSLQQKNKIAGWKEAATDAEKSIPVITWEDMFKLHETEIVNAGSAVGRLMVYSDDQTRRREFLDAELDEIVLIDSLPLSLSPVSGVITNNPTIFLSHVNILTKGWGVPSLYIKNAKQKLAQYHGQWVRLTVHDDQHFNEATGTYSIRLAHAREINAKKRRMMLDKQKKRQSLQLPEANLNYRYLTNLSNQRRTDSNKFGAKSANLGALIQAKIPNVSVPDGFSIPFVFYEEFISRNNLKPQIMAALSARKDTKKDALHQLRMAFLKQTFDPDLAKKILHKIHTDYSGVGLFIRSSTNAEDLPGFSGAGLYDTVANVSYAKQGDQAILQGIKKVWSSVWNDAAVAARENMGIEGKDHLKIYASILLQSAAKADSAGVMITKNPYQKQDEDVIYINAKRGLGMRVVEGEKIPEQILYRQESKSIIYLTHSTEEKMTVYDDNAGGVKEVVNDAENNVVLNHENVNRLVKVAQDIGVAFCQPSASSRGYVPKIAIPSLPSIDAKIRERHVVTCQPQEIEWLVKGEKVYIVQVRPFIE